MLSYLKHAALWRGAAVLFIATFPALAQTTPALPAAVSAVGEFNQLGSPRFSIGVSAIYAPAAQSNIRMYNSTTADIIPVLAKDPASGKSFYAINASIRQGVHEKIFCSGVLASTTPSLSKFCFLLGGDLGPGFQNSPTGVQISATASFVATAVYRINERFGLIFPERMLYLPGVGFNPIIQAGVLLSLGPLK